MSGRHVAEGEEIGTCFMWAVLDLLLTLVQKEAGTWNLIQFLENLEGFSLRALTAQGWKLEEIQVHLAQVRKEFKNPKFRMQHDG